MEGTDYKGDHQHQDWNVPIEQHYVERFLCCFASIEILSSFPLFQTFLKVQGAMYLKYRLININSFYLLF